MKKFLSITLSVVFVLILSVIPAFAAGLLYYDNDYSFFPNQMILQGSIAITETYYVEAGTMITLLNNNAIPNCAAFIFLTYLDDPADTAAISYGSLSATAGYSAVSVWDDLYSITTEHYGAYDLNGYQNPIWFECIIPQD